MNLNNDRPLIGKLIELGAHVLSADEAAQIAHACSDISEFLLFVQLDRKVETILTLRKVRCLDLFVCIEPLF